MALPRGRKYVYGKQKAHRGFARTIEAKVLLFAGLGVLVLIVVYLISAHAH